MYFLKSLCNISFQHILDLTFFSFVMPIIYPFPQIKKNVDTLIGATPTHLESNGFACQGNVTNFD
jgi:hypothetical protein